MFCSGAVIAEPYEYPSSPKVLIEVRVFHFIHAHVFTFVVPRGDVIYDIRVENKEDIQNRLGLFFFLLNLQFPKIMQFLLILRFSSLNNRWPYLILSIMLSSLNNRCP